MAGPAIPGPRPSGGTIMAHRDRARSGAGSSGSGRNPMTKKSRRHAPGLEPLEPRCLLSSIAEFSLSSPRSTPVAITTGPDGNLWFIEQGGNQVGTINPTTHAVTEYAIP